MRFEQTFLFQWAVMKTPSYYILRLGSYHNIRWCWTSGSCRGNIDNKGKKGPSPSMWIVDFLVRGSPHKLVEFSFTAMSKPLKLGEADGQI